MAERRLGRGLEYLISEGPRSGEEVNLLSLDEIVPNPFQPRKEFDATAEKSLAESIRQHGVLQPVVVRRGKEGFEVVAGERRVRASRRAGLSEIPCIQRTAADEEMLSLALVENIQREDLDPIEKARAFKDLMKRLELTQDGVARRIGISRAAVANFLRLLNLPKEIRDAVSRGTISFGHAKAIMALKDKSEQAKFFRRIVAGNLSVRETEKESKAVARKKKKRKKSSAQVSALEESLMEKLGTKVRIRTSGKGGKIVIDFYSPEDFERIADLIG